MGASKKNPSGTIVPDTTPITIVLKAGVARSLMALLDSGSPLNVQDAKAIATAITRGFIAASGGKKKKGKSGSKGAAVGAKSP